MSFEDKCYCQQLSAHKSVPLTAWDDLDSTALNNIRPKENYQKGRKPLGVKSRYGYETLEDRYKFCHHEDLDKYMEDYRNIFTVSNRAHKKPWKSNGLPYNLLRVAPPVRSRSVVRAYPKELADNRHLVPEHRESCGSEGEKRESEVEKDEQMKTTTTSPKTQSVTAEQVKTNSYDLIDRNIGQVDPSVDTVCDECEDEPVVEDRIPLVTQLNTFFLSRHGRRGTQQMLNNHSTANLFPHIHSTCEPTSHDFGDMTAASIINYKVPTAREKQRPTSHPKLIIQKNMDNGQQAMFKPLFERQKMQMFPMRTKSISTSNLNHCDQLHSAAQTTHKRFTALHLGKDSTNDKGLPKSHILTAKTINRTPATSGVKIDKQRVPRETEPTSSPLNQSPTNPIDSSSAYQTHLPMTYERKSLHPSLSSYSLLDRNIGRVELVDYSSAIASHYPN